VLLIGIVFSGISYIPASLLFASNKGATVARIRWCELVPYLMIAAGLTMKYGVLGAAAAWTLRALVDSLLLTIAVQKWKNPIPFSLGGFLKLGGTLAFLLPPVIVTAVFQVSWFWTGILTCVSLMLYVVNLWRRVLTSSERSWVSSVSRHLLLQSAEAK